MSDATPSSETIHVTKIDAASRQLNTALRLWFQDDDLISAHTLAYAAYEVIHVVSKARGRTRGLLFDSDMIKDEFRSDWNKKIKESANFFKHAKKEKDVETAIDFNPRMTEFFMIFGILGLSLGREEPGPIERAFLLWLGFHRPNFFSAKGRKRYVDSITVEIADEIRSLPKRLFLDAFMEGAASAG